MNSNSNPKSSQARDFLFITGYCLLIYGIGLTTSSLWDNDEGWYASMALNMYQTNDWIVPIYNASVWFTKPPLMFWIMGGAMKLFGPTEFAVRMFSVIFNTATVLLMYSWLRAWMNRSVAVYSAWVMATALLYAVVGRAAIADSYLVFFMTAALACFWFSLQRTRAEYWWAMAAGLSMGFAMLTKGPMGVGFPLLTMIAFCLVIGQGRVLLSRKVVLALLGCLLIASPWYIAGYIVSGPKIWYQFFIVENLLRFTVPSMGHKGPFWYHPPVFIFTFLPWSVLLPWAYVQFCRHESAAHKFIMAWISFPLIVYTVMITKLPHYLLHIFPAFAIVIGWFIARLVEEKKSIPSVALWIGLGLNFIVYVASFMVVNQEPEAIGWRLPLVLSLLPLSWLVALIASRYGKINFSITSLGLGTTGFILLLTLVIMPHFEQYRLVKPVLAKLTAAGFPPVPPEKTHLNELQTQDPDWLKRALQAKSVMFTQGDLIVPSMTFYSQSVVVRTSTDECAYLLRQATPVAILFQDNRWEEFSMRYPLIAQRSTILFEYSCIYEDEGRMRVIAVCNRKP